MRVILIFVISLFGCSQEQAKWHADKRFTAEEQVGIEQGIAWLEKASGRDFGGVAFDYEPTSEQRLDYTIRRELHQLGGIDETGLCEGKTIYIWPEARPDVNVTWSQEDMPGLAAHEMGHCGLGFIDDYGGNGIMGRTVPMSWTNSEQEQLDGKKEEESR